MNIGHLQEVGASLCDAILNFAISEGFVKDPSSVPGNVKAVAQIVHAIAIEDGVKVQSSTFREKLSVPDSYKQSTDETQHLRDDNDSVVPGEKDVDSGSDADSDNDANSLATDSKLFVTKKNQLMPTLANGRHVRNSNNSAVTGSGLLPVPPNTLMSKTLQPSRASHEGSIYSLLLTHSYLLTHSSLFTHSLTRPYSLLLMQVLPSTIVRTTAHIILV